MSTVAGALVLAIGLATGFEYVFDENLGVDWAPFGTGATLEGRPSPLTSAALAPLGGALVLFDAVLPRGIRAREQLLFLSIFFAFTALVGHVFGAGLLYRFESRPVIGVALPTSIALHLVAMGGLLARPRVGRMRFFTSPGPGGVLVRRLGIAAAIAGPLLGAMLLAIVRGIALNDLALVLALATVVGVFFVVLFVVITAIPLESAYEAQLESQKRISELLEHAPLGFFIADVAGRYTEVNSAGCRLLGYSREELLGKRIVDLLPPADVPRLATSRERLLSGAVEVGEWMLRRKDGTYAPVEVTAKIIPDGRWQAFVSDITDRVELERKLRESRDFLTGVLESSTEYGIIAEDLARRVVLWNEGARRTYGYSGEEILGAESTALVAAGDEAPWDELHARALEQGSAEGTLLNRRKDGSTFSAKVVCTRRLDAEGGTAGVLVVSRDLSLEQRYLAEQEFLARAGMELASCLDYRETVGRIAQLATSFLGDLVAIDVLRDGELRRVLVRHADPTQSEVVAELARFGSSLSPTHPVRRALESNEAFIIEGSGAEIIEAVSTSPEHAELLESTGIRSGMIVPLLARGQLLAVLSIASCDPRRAYGADDLRVAEALASRAGLALDNVQLWQQARLQGAVTTHLAEGVVLIRPDDGRIAYANPRFEAMFRYDPGELVGRPIHELNARSEITPEGKAREIMAQLRETGFWQGEIKNVRKDGTELWCAASVVEADHEDYGKIWISVHSDITARKELEEKNAKALREKEVLLKEIHHRVKNNLQVISSLFALQRQRTESRALKNLLDESRMRVQSIALVHEQLYGSADLAVIDFDEYLHALIGALRSSYGAEHVELEADAKGVMIEVEEAVPCALLICEVVSNSLKHAFPDRGGNVWVHAREEDGHCVLEVGDDGVGIPADFDWTTTRSLGLRLVRSLTHQLRGTVTLDRSSGTRFIVRFPLRHATTARDGAVEQVLH